MVNAASFEQYGLNALDTIFQHRPIAVAVGGTGLYLQALLQGLDAMPQVTEEVKARVAQGYAEGGLIWLQQEVKRLDSKYFAEVDTQNPVRLLRALEICYATQQPFSSFRNKQPVERPFNTVLLGLDLPRQLLYERINQRVHAMMQQGLLQEVEGVRPHQHLNALQTVGYTELFAHLRGEISLAAAIEKIQQHSRNYAKRQLTWFKRLPKVQWFEPHQLTAMMNTIEQAM
ncbi:MAG: tRNA (adenosine(37)-N6)-dimethylallyltransferase MiaA [Bacteroidetes bacterium]|nr:MAG: tRNA (adenosine(37)-N6)-dimethylallyltransferase MiaA [Bacteroidota bacterium]